MAECLTEVPCPACGWTAKQQRCCGYASTVKLFYGAGQRGAWSIGSDYILKERPNMAPQYEVPNIEYVKQHTTLPVPTNVREWVDEADRYFVMMERIKGETLEDAWPTLSQEAKERIADQVAEYLRQMRQLTSSKMQSVNGNPIYSAWLFHSGPSTPQGPFDSDAEFWDALAVALEKLPAKVVERFRERFPPCEPYTFTHGDLTICNIMVKDGNLSGIIDWEGAGYFPAWWEYTAAGIGLSDEDADWKALLRERMDPFPQAREFWKDFYFLNKFPELNERGQALMDQLLEP